VLADYSKMHEGLIKVYRFEKNVGLGVALAKGITLCSNELIARMDADDFADPERCAKQIKILENNPKLDVVGSNVEEFVGDINNVVSHVILPEKQDEIISFAKKRCPIRHPALMYRKSAVLKAGNYRDYRHAQDYNLIVHMILSGSQIYNIQENLTYMRVSVDFYKRRGGLSQAKLVLRLKKEFLDCGFYSFSDYLISGVGNAFIAILPNKLRECFYKKVLRR
jgi:glycosyltransferase involved in cell wall biosynthesis